MKFLKVLSVIICVAAAALLGHTLRQAQAEQTDGGPQITFENEVLNVRVNTTKEQLLEDVTALDGKDGDVTASLVVEDISTFLDDGSRIVTYAAFDSDQNVTKVSRHLTYTDYKAPEFTLSEPLSFRVGSKINVLEYVTATDCLDGDISADIIQSWDEDIDLTVAGDYTVQLKVSNSAGDVAVLPLPVHIYDTLQNDVPKIQLSGYLFYTDVGKTIDARSLIEQVEVNDLVVTAAESEFPSVLITDNVNYSVPGSYSIRYAITDEQGMTGTAEIMVVVRSTGVTLESDDTYGLVINGWDEFEESNQEDS